MRREEMHMRSGGTGVSVILLTLMTLACATHGARPAPFPTPEAARETTPDPAPSYALGAAVADAALALLGTPYAPGGSGPDRFDCSGLVQFVFARHEVALPRTVTDQFSSTVPIASDQVVAGDLLFFSISGSHPSHVAIALGDGRFVHAPSSRGVVRVESLAAPYWYARFLSAHRVR